MSPQHQLFEVPKMEPSPQWDCQKQIGAGGFAQVFLESITRPVFGTQLCAVKRIIKEDVKFPRKSYMQEINIFSKLNQNDWFVQFFASHEDSQHIYIAMEYIAWGDLGKYIDFGWDERDAAIVAHQLLCGLQYLHQKGITHRDLKPANIFPVPQTDGTLRIKIGDFGVSKHIPIDGSTYLRTEVGTASYMAPEVIGSQYTCTVDCFSLGCLVYRLIAGNDLFQNVQEIYQFAFQGIPSPRSALLEWGLCTNDCADIVGKLITARPEGRLDAVAALNHPWMFRFSTTALLHNKVVSWGESLSQNESPGYLISNKLWTRFMGSELMVAQVRELTSTAGITNPVSDIDMPEAQGTDVVNLFPFFCPSSPAADSDDSAVAGLEPDTVASILPRNPDIPEEHIHTILLTLSGHVRFPRMEVQRKLATSFSTGFLNEFASCEWWRYLQHVQLRFQYVSGRRKYDQFLECLKRYRAKCISINVVTSMVTKLLSGHPDLLHSFNYFLLHNLIPPIGSQKNAVYTVVHARHGRPKRSYQDYRTDLEDTREWRTNRRRKISDVISKPAGRLSFLSTKSSRLDHTKEHPGWQQNGIPLRVPDMVARLNQERMMPQNDRERRSPDCGIIPDITLTSSCWESSSSGIVTFSEPEVLDTEPRHILVFESELEWSTDSPTRPPTPVLIEAPSERSMDQNGGDEPVYSIVINSFPTSTWDARPEDSRSHEDLEFYDMEFRLSSMLELEAAFERNAPSSPGPT